MLRNYSIIKITGPDAEKFLQGQLSNDVAQLKELGWQLSCYCNQKGRIIAFLWLAFFGDAYYLCLPSSSMALTLAELKKFGAFSKVQIQVSEDLKLAAIFDENAANVRENVLVEMNYAPMLSLALVETELTSPTYIEPEQWKLANINNELPIISQEQQEKFTPHQLNLQTKNALAFKKGCYRGQEIVARMEYLGKLKQQLYRVEIKSKQDLKPLSPILTPEDKIIGEIVNIITTEANSYLALAVLNKAAIEAANAGIIALNDEQELKIL